MWVFDTFLSSGKNKLCRRGQKIFKVDFTNTIMFGWFFRKKEVEQIKEDTKKGFDSVKKDITSLTEWIKHLDSENNSQKEDLREVKEILSSINEDLEGIKNVVNIMNEAQTQGVFKTPKRKKDKQTAVYAVQTGVQTAVQTPNLE